jgi:uncharacterized protein (UPF0305 family)
MEKLSMYKPKLEQKMLAGGPHSDSIGSIMTRYNYNNFIEILNTSGIDPDLEVDDDKLKDFQIRIDSYLNAHAPDDADLRLYIKGITAYLVFIARKPLHPPGLKFDNGAEVTKKGDVFYCGGRRAFIKDDLSLCRFCICRSPK